MRGLHLAEAYQNPESLDYRENVQRYLPMDQKRAALFIGDWEGLVLVTLRRMRVEGEQDVLYRVFERALKGLAQFRGDSKISTWLYRISMREAVRSLGVQNKRDSRFTLQGDFELHETVQESAEGMLMRLETSGRVQRSLEKLNPMDREILALRFAEELKYKEIAERFEIPLATVKVRVHRALKRLEKKLEQDHEQ